MLLSVLAGCDASTPAVVPASDEPAAQLAGLAARLGAYEDQRRAAFDPEAASPWSASAGDEPWAIAAIDAGSAVGVLRGRDALVLLDASGAERDRLDGLDDPVAVTVDDAGWIHALGSRGELWRVRVDGGGFAQMTRSRAPGAGQGRAVLAAPPGLLIAQGDAIVSLADGGTVPSAELVRCGGPIGLASAGGLVAAPCLFDRGLALAELAPGGATVVRTGHVVHDGPLWSAAVAAAGGRWIVAAGGVEDHPLDRSDGFGYVDPHVFVLEVSACDTGLCTRRIAAINVGEWGVVMPKWVDVAVHDESIALTMSGYGGERLTRVDVGFDGHLGEPSHVAVAPGLRQLARVGAGWLGANPLLDRWVRIDDDGTTRLVTPPGTGPARDVEVRVGEALFFTTLLTPGAQSTGMRSRFTCETCHFEGTVDGRVHYTGRADIHAATKPLLGLFVNRPHFSRALDRTLAVMVDNEFDVANRGSALGPHFHVSPAELPWLAELGVTEAMGPEALRRAFMAFFIAFDHETSPAVVGRTELTSLELEGARLFAEHCEGCHRARTVADDPGTRVPPSRWPALVLSASGPLVWASEARVRTGVEPYVHPEGARVTSLRRLALKRPYFTNGSARSLDEVLERVRLRPEFAHHPSDAAPSGATAPPRDHALDEAARRALRAFLVLL